MRARFLRNKVKSCHWESASTIRKAPSVQSHDVELPRYSVSQFGGRPALQGHTPPSQQKMFTSPVSRGVAAVAVAGVGYVAYSSAGASQSTQHNARTPTNAMSSSSPGSSPSSGVKPGGSVNGGGSEGTSSKGDSKGMGDKMSGNAGAKAKFEEGVGATKEGKDAVGRRGGLSSSG
ncbi:hypothetical protein P7C70_g7365, partial [Phenoliferia sp. Uapishka_3]